MAWLGRQPFRRVFDRCILVLALAGLWPLLRASGIRSLTELGYVRNHKWWRHALIGLLLGVISFAAAGAILVALGTRNFKEGLEGSELISSISKFALIGVVVALIEETFFRGGLQGVLQRRYRLAVAVAIISAVYSVVHFLKPQGADVSASAVTWLSGFDYLWQVIPRSWHQPGAGCGFVTLWLAGCVLGVAFVETGALYLSIGIHAGWVLALKSFAFCTTSVIMRKPAWWMRDDPISNPLVWPVFLILLALVYWLCRNKLRSLR